ncbi:MAG: SusC/RagA family TonB-linked outer membrane protein [Saprospiraceae bacterium]|nr:SusC/RagA family TonB-linked outer membrane protein [Saprospiraceae bacterium]
MKLKAKFLYGCWLIAVVLLCSNAAFAQRTITGTITDAQSKEPLIGANILVVGTSIGGISDIDGTYSLQIPAGATELEFSYTGYTAQRIAIGASNVIDVLLQAGEVLDEIVVIGYGTVKKEDATGAVNAISSKNFNKGAIVSPDQLITGKVAGVQITSNSGEPGGQTSVRIRGGTSVNASNEPLYVIDGVPIDNAPHNPGGFSSGRNPLNFLNPNDIETFTVLKDASATAIYGSRGANGVIIITTKKGKAGERSRLTYDGYYNTAEFAGEPDVFGEQDFRNLVTFKAPERLAILGNNDTNWFDEVTQTASGQSHNLGFTGGGENMGYRLSAGYQSLEGVVRASKTERTNFSLNYNHSLFDSRLNINANIKGSFTKDQYDPNVGASASSFDPTQAVYDPTNTAFGGYFEYPLPQSPRNPVSFIEQQEDFGKSFRNIGNLEFDYKFNDFVPGLTAKLNLGYDINNGERKRFQPTTLSRPPFTNYTGELRRENFTRLNTLLDAYLNYNRSFGSDHRLDFTAGYSYQNFYNEYPSFRAFDLTTDIFGSNSTAPATEFEAFNSVVENRLISFFGRANYSFQDKYLLTVTVRRDGSTRFGENNRWGTFPSAAFAWRIMQEDFAESLSSTFSDLKLRLGYGITGNQEIGDFRYLPTYSFERCEGTVSIWE